ncbi:Enzyme of the cupin superfamily [Seminavis robusta]|uniref:Enzyme of the cupin superfamily n=1 Tax=Seminavis robusta TaxID=568900 RepID=A0A9N8EJF7_9STRA|nr:Enzyme of the cupin superfamily [Seminavis robusta]|eukprot:Sro1178_g249460.1 Enzyme of the cupin superfamily (323) ;mRNA; f:2411-3379
MNNLFKPLVLLSLWGSQTCAFVGSTIPPRPPSSLALSYLESLQTQTQVTEPTPAVSGPLATVGGASPVNGAPPAAATERLGFCHVPMEYFGLDKLSSKGPRATFDWGAPQDWSRKLADDGEFRAGSWYCSEGGWASPKGKAVTEVFYVLSGYGCLGDADGVKHYFGPGDVVVIPKGHTGRWDVNEPIHKVWAVNDHPRVEEQSTPIRVRVDHYNTFASQYMVDTSGNDPLYGDTVPAKSATNTLYNIGPTKVGVWSCEKGSFQVHHGARSWFHMLEGVLFVTDASDGNCRRCVAGDTVMLPEGWYGWVDVIEPAKKVWVTAA